MTIPSEIQLIALSATLLSEGVGMVVFSVISRPDRAHWLRNLMTTIGTNLATHTAFWYALPFVRLDGSVKLCGFEMLIVIVEAGIYRTVCHIALWKASLLSLLLNLTSFLTGIYLWQILN